MRSLVLGFFAALPKCSAGVRFNNSASSYLPSSKSASLCAFKVFMLMRSSKPFRSNARFTISSQVARISLVDSSLFQYLSTGRPCTL